MKNAAKTRQNPPSAWAWSHLGDPVAVDTNEINGIPSLLP